ncbi:hypothetical protein GCM10022393_24140 [Aquimarina addita]|uniref:Uncharacterized protein n=1 Tax=Aquimarina addita TaxID=870485 RepID=A0ABP6UN55_9FLAO
MNDMSRNNIIRIDQFLENNKGFWKGLESFCVIECCGVDALDLSKEHIKKTVSFYNIQHIITDIDQSIEWIHTSSGKLISSSILNHCVSQKKFIELLKNIKLVLLRVSV